MASTGQSDTDNPDREQQRDISHAARSGGMQVLTVAAQALLSITHVLLARLLAEPCLAATRPVWRSWSW